MFIVLLFVDLDVLFWLWCLVVNDSVLWFAMEGLFLLLFGIGVCVSSLCLLCYFVLCLAISFVFRCGFCGLILFALQVVVFGFLLVSV